MMEIPNMKNMSGGEARPEKYLGFAALVLVLLSGAILRIWLSINDDGIYWPDEIYQSLEPAHRLIFGYGLKAWEFIEGARNWAVPGFIAFFLRLCPILGYGDPAQYIIVIRIIFSAISIGTALGSYRLSRAYGATPIASACAAAFVALGSTFIFFAPRAMAENISALPLIFGLAFAMKRSTHRRDIILGASLIGISVILRIHNGIFCLGLLGFFAGQKRWPAFRDCIITFFIWALLFGLLDELTWGGWFHSAIVYLRFNLIEGKSSQWGTMPFSFYFESLWSSMGSLAVTVGILSLFSILRAKALFFTALAFLFIHSMIGHKELRFLLPALPVFGSLAAIGIDEISSRLNLRRASYLLPAAVILLSLKSGIGFHSLKNGDLIGSYDTLNSMNSAYDKNGPINRLLISAHKAQDLCGLKIEAARIEWTGGFGYLHRDVPLYSKYGHLPEPKNYNYSIISADDLEEDEETVAEDGNYLLVRHFTGPCMKDDAYESVIPK